MQPTVHLLARPSYEIVSLAVATRRYRALSWKHVRVVQERRLSYCFQFIICLREPTSLARLPNGRRIKRGREERGWKGMGDCKFRELGYLRCALVKRKKRKKEKELFLSLLTGYWKNKTKASLITPLAKDARIYFYALRIREISSRNIGYRYLGCFTSCL